MLIVIIWILCGIGAAVIAKSRGANSGSWFFIGLLFGPFGILYAAIQSRGATCSACYCSVHPNATKCPHCQSNLGELYQLPKPPKQKNEPRPWVNAMLRREAGVSSDHKSWTNNYGPENK